MVCLKSRDSNARANGRDRKSGGANIIGANGLAMEWRARSPLQMARVHRGFGTYQGCALTPTSYSRHSFQTHDCRVSCLGRALRRLTTADVFDWRCVDAARRRCPSASSSCCRKPRAGLHSASIFFAASAHCLGAAAVMGGRVGVGVGPRYALVDQHG